MARTAEAAQLTRDHRRQQLALRAATLRDLVALWAAVDPVNLAGSIGAFSAAAAVLVRSRNRDSSSLAARYFRDFRAAEGIAGTITARLAPVPPADVVAGTIRGAALSGIIHARRRGFAPAAAARQGLVKVSGSATSLVLGGSRETIIRSGASDPRAERWQRVTSDAPCSFCAMLASRGAAFSAQTADFEAHDHCSCEPEIAYPGSTMTDQARQFRDEWDRAQREVSVEGTSNDALNAFRRLREGRA